MQIKHKKKDNNQIKNYKINQNYRNNKNNHNYVNKSMKMINLS